MRRKPDPEEDRFMQKAGFDFIYGRFIGVLVAVPFLIAAGVAWEAVNAGTLGIGFSELCWMLVLAVVFAEVIVYSLLKKRFFREQSLRRDINKAVLILVILFLGWMIFLANKDSFTDYLREMIRCAPQENSPGF